MKSLGVIAAIGAILYGLYLVAFPSVTVHYRLELVADVEGKPVSSAGVVEVRYGKRIPWLSNYGGGITIDVKGEAVAVDLGARGVLFALLKAGKHVRSGPDSIVPLAFDISTGGIGVEHFTQIQDVRGRRNLSFDILPLLVRFSNIADPRSVQRVDPDDLAASFGSGVALRSATIEITSDPVTSDPVTSGTEKRLPWLDSSQPVHEYTSCRNSFVEEFEIMAIHADVFRAILTMDSYNRGYNAGITQLSDASNTQIGNATIMADAQDPEGEAEAASFYAIAYTLADGSRVISYRGTDRLPIDVLAYPLSYQLRLISSMA